MNYNELIEHILGNSKTYIEEYKKKEKLTEFEKGILQGLWFDVDSIKNQLEMEQIEGNNIKEVKKMKNNLNLEKIMKQLEELINQ